MFRHFWERQKMTPQKSKLRPFYLWKSPISGNTPAYYIAVWEDSLHKSLNLHYSGETGDDDFPRLCTEILSTLLENYQTFFCTYGDITYGYQFPGGWISREGEPFSLACRRYAAEEKQKIGLLVDGKEAGIFPAKGLSETLLTSYFSNPWNKFRASQFNIFAYREDQPVEANFSAQWAKLDSKTCDIFVTYTELPNQLEVALNNDFLSISEVLNRVLTVCEASGKTVTLVKHPLPEKES